MKFTCINVGYGDSLLFEGKTVSLIDTGSGQKKEYDSVGRITSLDYLKGKGIKNIDNLIITHIHEDHVGKLDEIIKSFNILKIFVPKGFTDIRGIKDKSKDIPYKKHSTPLFYSALLDYSNAMQLCDDMNIPITEIDMGDSFSIGEMKLKALFTNKDSRELFLKYSKTLNSIDNLELYNEILEEMDACSNETSLLLKIDYGQDFHGLFCADNVPTNWIINEKFISEIQDVNFLKIPHHAQADAVDKSIMRYMPLKMCLTTASSDFRYNSSNNFVYETLLSLAKEDNRKLICLFSDPSTECKFWNEKVGYRALEFALENMSAYKIIF